MRSKVELCLHHWLTAMHRRGRRSECHIREVLDELHVEMRRRESRKEA